MGLIAWTFHVRTSLTRHGITASVHKVGAPKSDPVARRMGAAQVDADCVLRDERASEPSLFDKLPNLGVVVVIVLEVGVAIYFGRMWPLRTIACLDHIPLALHELNAFAKVVVFIVGAAAVLCVGCRFATVQFVTSF